MMSDQKSKIRLNESQSSVQTHLNIYQNIIQRMANNSSSCKTWCVTTVSAVMVLAADKQKPTIMFVSLVPLVTFLVLDAYYLALEKSFRQSYNDFVRKVHSNEATSEDLYLVSAHGNWNTMQLQAIASFSVWGFYLLLVLMVVLAFKFTT